MQQQIEKMQKDLLRLKLYAGVLTLLLITIGLFAFTGNRQSNFKEISVERINVLESNGQLRMVIANKKRSPENLSYGKPFTPPIAGGNRPGLIFYNDEGTENGGLIFTGGRDSSGKYQAFGHFSFDQYNQNQVLYLSYNDENGKQNTGLHIDDWQTSPSFNDWRAQYKKVQKLPDSPEKDGLIQKLMEPQKGERAYAKRVFVGKDDSKTAMVILSDRMGKPRLQLLVDSIGTAKINFVDENGKVTFSLPK